MNPYATEKPPPGYSPQGSAPPGYNQPSQNYGQQPAPNYGQPVQGMAYGQPAMGQPMGQQIMQPGQPMMMQQQMGQPFYSQPMMMQQQQGQPVMGQPVQPYGQQQMPVGQPVYNQQAIPVQTMTTISAIPGRWERTLCSCFNRCDYFGQCLVAACCAPCVLGSNLSTMGMDISGVVFLYFPLWVVAGYMQQTYGHGNFSDCTYSENSDGERSDSCISRTAQAISFICWFFLSMLGGYYRSKIRAKYAITQAMCVGHPVDDTCTHLFCAPCALSQEYTQSTAREAVHFSS